MTVAASTQRPPRAPTEPESAGMHERAAIAGAELTVHSAPGAGTAVRIELPLVPPAIPGDED